MRWVVGDVHGCARELDELLRTIRFDPDRDELWCVGDLINRGPDSLETLRLWRSAGGRSVIGNHEISALLSYSGRRRKSLPMLRALFGSPDADALMAELRALPALAHLPPRGDGPDAWIVHAGLDPRWSDPDAVATRVNAAVRDDDWLESADVTLATSVRCCDAYGRMCPANGPPEACPPPFAPWDAFYRGNAIVVHGHWAMRGYHRTGRTIGLDSGCAYGGTLTAWCQEEDRVVQIPSRTSV